MLIGRVVVERGIEGLTLFVQGDSRTNVTSKIKASPLCIDWPTLEGKLIRYDKNMIIVLICL